MDYFLEQRVPNKRVPPSPYNDRFPVEMPLPVSGPGEFLNSLF